MLTAEQILENKMNRRKEHYVLKKVAYPTAPPPAPKQPKFVKTLRKKTAKARKHSDKASEKRTELKEGFAPDFKAIEQGYNTQQQKSPTLSHREPSKRGESRHLAAGVKPQVHLSPKLRQVISLDRGPTEAEKASTISEGAQQPLQAQNLPDCATSSKEKAGGFSKRRDSDNTSAFDLLNSLKVTRESHLNDTNAANITDRLQEVPQLPAAQIALVRNEAKPTVETTPEEMPSPLKQTYRLGSLRGSSQYVIAGQHSGSLEGPINDMLKGQAKSPVFDVQQFEEPAIRVQQYQMVSSPGSQNRNSQERLRNWHQQYVSGQSFGDGPTEVYEPKILIGVVGGHTEIEMQQRQKKAAKRPGRVLKSKTPNERQHRTKRQAKNKKKQERQVGELDWAFCRTQEYEVFRETQMKQLPFSTAKDVVAAAQRRKFQVSKLGRSDDHRLGSKNTLPDNVGGLLADWQKLGNDKAARHVQRIRGYEKTDEKLSNNVLARKLQRHDEQVEKDQMDAQHKTLMKRLGLNSAVQLLGSIETKAPKPIGSYFVRTPNLSADGLQVMDPEKRARRAQVSLTSYSRLGTRVRQHAMNMSLADADFVQVNGEMMRPSTVIEEREASRQTMISQLKSPSEQRSHSNPQRTIAFSVRSAPEGVRETPRSKSVVLMTPTGQQVQEGPHQVQIQLPGNMENYRASNDYGQALDGTRSMPDEDPTSKGISERLPEQPKNSTRQMSLSGNRLNTINERPTSSNRRDQLASKAESMSSSEAMRPTFGEATSVKDKKPLRVPAMSRRRNSDGAIEQNADFQMRDHTEEGAISTLSPDLQIVSTLFQLRDTPQQTAHKSVRFSQEHEPRAQTNRAEKQILHKKKDLTIVEDSAGEDAQGSMAHLDIVGRRNLGTTSITPQNAPLEPAFADELAGRGPEFHRVRQILIEQLNTMDRDSAREVRSNPPGGNAAALSNTLYREKNRSAGVDSAVFRQSSSGQNNLSHLSPSMKQMWNAQRMRRQASGDHTDLVVNGQTLLTSSNATGGSFTYLRGKKPANQMSHQNLGTKKGSLQASKQMILHGHGEIIASKDGSLASKFNPFLNNSQESAVLQREKESQEDRMRDLHIDLNLTTNQHSKELLRIEDGAGEAQVLSIPPANYCVTPDAFANERINPPEKKKPPLEVLARLEESRKQLSVQLESQQNLVRSSTLVDDPANGSSQQPIQNMSVELRSSPTQQPWQPPGSRSAVTPQVFISQQPPPSFMYSHQFVGGDSRTDNNTQVVSVNSGVALKAQWSRGPPEVPERETLAKQLSTFMHQQPPERQLFQNQRLSSAKIVGQNIHDIFYEAQQSTQPQAFPGEQTFGDDMNASYRVVTQVKKHRSNKTLKVLANPKLQRGLSFTKSVLDRNNAFGEIDPRIFDNGQMPPKLHDQYSAAQLTSGKPSHQASKQNLGHQNEDFMETMNMQQPSRTEENERDLLAGRPAPRPQSMAALHQQAHFAPRPNQAMTKNSSVEEKDFKTITIFNSGAEGQQQPALEVPSASDPRAATGMSMQKSRQRRGIRTAATKNSTLTGSRPGTRQATRTKPSLALRARPDTAITKASSGLHRTQMMLGKNASNMALSLGRVAKSEMNTRPKTAQRHDGKQEINYLATTNSSIVKQRHAQLENKNAWTRDMREAQVKYLEKLQGTQPRTLTSKFHDAPVQSGQRALPSYFLKDGGSQKPQTAQGTLDSRRASSAKRDPIKQYKMLNTCLTKAQILNQVLQ